MDVAEIIEKLEAKGLKPTSNRILVMKTLAEENRPVSLSDLEMIQETMDKSSIFRVLTTFLEHDVVDAFEDGRGILHYELCLCDGACDNSDAHFHFYCESCHQTFCLKEVHIPRIALPDGFTQRAVSFVIKGTCAACRKTRFEA